jgi:dTDP-4-dehydrorhamnose reductase
MRVLVTGGGGLLGGALIRGAPSDVELHATRRSTPVEGATAHIVELSDAAAVEALLDRVRPEVVIHTAYGKTDMERDVVRATRSVAEACRRTGAALVHVSTDVVFDGEQAPYDESSAPSPISDYGRAKAEAERIVAGALPAAAIVRTSVIVRADEENEVVKLLRAGTFPPAFVDELRCPIEVDDLAAQLWEMAALPPERLGGVWHLAGPEALSRYALAVLLAHRFGIGPSVVTPGLNRAFTPPRPRDLRMGTARADRELRARARPVSEALFPIPH